MKKSKCKLVLICGLLFFVSTLQIAMADWEPQDGWKMHYPSWGSQSAKTRSRRVGCMPAADDRGR